MKIKNFLKLVFGFALTVGTLNVAMAKTNNNVIQTNAADVTTGSVLMNTNGNIRYISKSDNPDVWSSSTTEKGDYGRFEFSDFTNKGGIANGWGTAESDGSGTLLNTPFTYTGRASNSMTFTESEASKNCVGLYIPICFYAASVPAYTKVTFKVNVNVRISGGNTRNFVTAQFFHGGSVGTEGAKQQLPQVFYIPKNSDYLKTIGYDVLNIGQGDNVGAASSTGTFSYYVTVENTTGTAKHMEAYYGGLFLGGRKDSTTTHKIVGSISASASEIETSKYVCTNTTTGINYESLSIASANVGNGDTLVLNSDITSGGLSFNRNFTLDLNGHTINLNSSMLAILAGFNITLKGTGTIKANKTGAVIANSGTLTVPNTVSVINNYSTLTSYGISNAGTLNFAGSVTAAGNAIRTTDGTTYITGGTVSASLGQAIYINGGAVYLSNSPTITSGSAYENIYLNISGGTLYGYNKSYYGGSTLSLHLSALPAVNTIVVNKTMNNKFLVTNQAAHGYEFQYTSDRNIVYVKSTTFTVTYNANGGTGTLTDSTEYLVNESATVKANTFTLLEHTFKCWNTKSDGSGTNYNPGNTITITQSITLYAVWYQTDSDKVDEFCRVYLKMTTYDVGLDNSNGNGSCTTYYSVAKSKYLELPSDAKTLFATNAKYSNAKARFEAWAKANGETINFNDSTFNKLANYIPGANITADNTSAIIITSIALIGIIGLAFIFKKKRS